MTTVKPTKHLYLPPLDTDVNLGAPGSGQWGHGGHQRFLATISESIQTGEIEDGRGISSVPDVWARPLVFQAALRPNSRHPLHARIVQEWRGLLSLLALRQIHGYPVEIVPVELEDGSPFTTALGRLQPRAVQLEAKHKYDWTRILLIRYDGVAVGALSPTTLVYTGVGYGAKLKGRPLNLVDADGFLVPPAHDADDKRRVGEWVDQLKTRLNVRFFTGHENPDNGHILALNALLDGWLQQLRQELELGRGEAFSDDVALASEPAGLPDSAALLEAYGVYAELLRPLVRADRGARPHSDIALQPRRNRHGYAEVVVITSRLLQRGGQIWDEKKLSHLGGDVAAVMQRHFDGSSGVRIDNKDLSKSNAIWIRPERYFLSDTLVAPTGSGTFLTADEAPANFGGRFLLPFRPEILDFFSPEEIATELRPTFTEVDGGVVFSFQLPVTGHETERVERTYRVRPTAPSDGAVRTRPVPVVELFPKYLGKEWRRYYLFHSGAEELRVDPVWFGNAIEPSDRVHRVPNSPRRIRLVELAGDDPFPEALTVATTAGRPEYLGLVLLDRDERPRTLSGKWRIGVDFGTSNTHVFRQSHREGADAWSFDFPRYLRQVTAGPADERSQMLANFFIPATRYDLPVPTNLRVFEDGQLEHTLLDYFIYFSPEGRDYRLPENVHSNIKWDEQERKTEHFLTSLLFLILAEVVDSGKQEMEFAFSYPRAFSQDARSMFQRECEVVLKKLLTDSERVVTLRRGSGDKSRPQLVAPSSESTAPGVIPGKMATFVAEGIASGKFFSSGATIPNTEDQADIQGTALCLDMGGGTTDISLWHNNEIALDASILLAGRQVSRLLQQKNPRQNPRLTELLFSTEAAVALEEESEPSPFAARLNVVLKKEEEEIEAHLIKHSNRPEVRWLRRMLAVEFGAVTFYTAALLGAADRAQGGAVLDHIRQDGIRLHWGGNAAKLINWIDLGRYSADGIAARMLNAILFQAMRDLLIDRGTTQGTVAARGLGQLQSPGHKSEAAGGLVVMDFTATNRRPSDAFGDGLYDMGGATAGTSGDESELETADGDGPAREQPDGTGGVVCGEDIELTSGLVGYTDLISDAMLFGPNGTTTFKSTTLKRLTRFVEIVNFFGVKWGLLNEGTRIDLDRHRPTIAREVGRRFKDTALLKPGRRTVEPVFITEVTTLLDLLRNDAP